MGTYLRYAQQVCRRRGRELPAASYPSDSARSRRNDAYAGHAKARHIEYVPDPMEFPTPQPPSNIQHKNPSAN